MKIDRQDVLFYVLGQLDSDTSHKVEEAIKSDPDLKEAFELFTSKKSGNKVEEKK